MATGLRRTDVVGIRLSDITPEALRVVTSKTKAPLEFKMKLGLRGILDAARALPGRRTSVYLFADRQGQPYDPQDVSLAFRRVTERLGVSGVTFHSCRAWAITQTEQALGLRAAQAFAGHSQVAQTERYLRGEYVPVDPLDIGQTG
jgi:integrase